MRSKDKGNQKRSTGNPWGHYRKPPSIEEFKAYFDRNGDVAVLKQFLGNTASWVYENFAPVELEVHQGATMGKAAKQSNGTPDYAAVKKQCPRLAIIATDAELKGIVEPPEGVPKVKDLRPEFFLAYSTGAKKVSRSGPNTRSSVIFNPSVFFRILPGSP